MKIRRKAITLQAWHNTKGKAVNERPAESMPIWLQKVAEPAAKPDTTFVINDPKEDRGTKVVHAGDVVYLAPDGSIHAINLARFKQEYEIADIQAKVSTSAKPEDAVPEKKA